MTHDEWIIFAIDHGLVYDREELAEWRRQQTEKNAKKIAPVADPQLDLSFMSDDGENG